MAAAVALILIVVGVTTPVSTMAAQPAPTRITLAQSAGRAPNYRIAGNSNPVITTDIRAEMTQLRRAAATRASRATRPTRTAAARPPTVRHTVKPHRRTKRPTTPPRARASKPAVPVLAANSSRARAIVAFVLAQVGKPYVWAADGPGSYDCSGLVMAAYARVGIKLPHFTGGIAGRGRRVSRGELEPGDIVFPSSHHVGIYIGGGRMVHAPKPGDHVKISSVYAFWSARRLL